MSNPTKADWIKLKHIAKYILPRGRVAHWYAWQAPTDDIAVMVDSNRARCPKTRTSNTGIAIMFGQCLLQTAPRTQRNIALSFAEA